MDVGYSIASRTFQCTGNQKLANRRYEAFDDTYTCVAPSPQNTEYAQFFDCSIQVYRTSCDDVERFADDLDAWLGASTMCRQILQRVDGSALPTGGAGGVGGAGGGGAAAGVGGSAGTGGTAATGGQP